MDRWLIYRGDGMNLKQFLEVIIGFDGEDVMNNVQINVGHFRIRPGEATTKMLIDAGAENVIVDTIDLSQQPIIVRAHGTIRFV